MDKGLVGKPEGKSPLVRPRRRWEDNIKMDLEEVGRACGDWMGKVMGACEYGNELLGSVKWGKLLD